MFAIIRNSEDEKFEELKDVVRKYAEYFKLNVTEDQLLGLASSLVKYSNLNDLKRVWDLNVYLGICEDFSEAITFSDKNLYPIIDALELLDLENQDECTNEDNEIIKMQISFMKDLFENFNTKLYLGYVVGYQLLLVRENKIYTFEEFIEEMAMEDVWSKYAVGYKMIKEF